MILTVEERKNIRFGPHDRRILWELYIHQGLTTEQVINHVYNPDPTVGLGMTRAEKRLKRLYDGGYIARQERAALPSEGRLSYIHHATKRAAPYIAEYAGKNVDEILTDFPKPKKGYIRHFVKRNDIRVILENSIEHHGLRLTKWLTETDLIRLHRGKKFGFKPPGKKAREGNLIPDDFFRLETKEFMYDFFVEIDLSTETIKARKGKVRDWYRKIWLYLSLRFNDNAAQEIHGLSSFQVLVMTTSERRLENLVQVCREVLMESGKMDFAADMFWFTTFEEVHYQTVLVRPIWTVAGFDGTWSILQEGWEPSLEGC